MGTTTTSEEFGDGNGHGHGFDDFNQGIKSIFNWNHGQNYDDGRIELFGNNNQRFPMFVQTNDPLKKLRDKWQAWKWNPYNWNKDENGMGNRDDTFIGNRNYQKNKSEEIEWQSYKDYRSMNKKPTSLLDDIVNDDK